MIDCPPSLGILTLNALAAVSEVLIPLQPHFFALHGLSKLLETIDLVAARINDKLKLSGVILCMYDGGTRLAAEVGQDVDEFFRKARGQPTPWADAQTFRRGFAATSAWPRPPASASRSSNTPRFARGRGLSAAGGRNHFTTKVVGCVKRTINRSAGCVKCTINSRAWCVSRTLQIT